MPWLMCTTGSPIFSSDRSRTIDFDLRRAFLALAADAAAGAGVQLGFGDESQIAQFRTQLEAGIQRRHAQHHWGAAAGKLGIAVARLEAQIVLVEVLLQRFAAAMRFGADQHALVGLQQIGAQVDQRIVGAAVDGDIRNRRRQFGRRRAGLDHPAPVGLGQREEILVAQEQGFRRQQRPLAVRLQEVVARLRIGPEAPDRAFDIADQREQGVGRQVVEQRRGLLEKQRQIVFDAGRGDAVADVLVDRRTRRIAFKHFAPAAAKGIARRFVHRKFAPRQQPHFAHRIERALGVGVEGADGVDGVAEQVDPVRQRRAHRKQVDQAAAHRVFAGRHHLRDVGIAGQRQLRFEARLVQRLALLEEKGIGGQERRRRHPQQRGGGGHDQHVALTVLDFIQRRQPLRHQVLMRRKGVVRQGFPVRQDVAAQFRRAVGAKPRDFGAQALGIGGVGDHYRQHPVLRFQLSSSLRQQTGIGRTVQAGQGETMTGFGKGFCQIKGHRVMTCGMSWRSKSVRGIGFDG